MALKIYGLLLFVPITCLPVFGQDTLKKVTPIQEVVVTGQFEPTSLKKSVFTVKSIRREEILRRGTSDLLTVLNTQLGIRLSNDLVLGETDIELMGMSGQNVKVLLDGVPIIDRGSTKQSLSQIDLNTVESIEIIEGPVSVMYGSDALAGAINIITRNNTQAKESWDIQVRLLEETVNKEYSVAHAEGRHNAHINLNYHTRNWYAQWTGSRNNFGGYQGNHAGRSLTWQPKDQWLTSGKVGFRNNGLHVFYHINYTNEDIYTPGDIQANYRYTDKNYITDRWNQAVQAEWKTSDRLKFTGILTQQNYKRATQTKIYDLSQNSVELSTATGDQDVSKFYQTFGRVTGHYKWTESLDLLAGLDLDFDKGTGGRILDKAEIYDVAGYIMADFRPSSWLLVRPGIRFIHNSVYHAPPAIPSVNAKFILTPELDLRASYAKGFRAPSLRELYFSFFDSNHSIEGNRNLKAEHNDSYQLNLNYQTIWNDKWSINSSLGGFYNNFKNLIIMAMKPDDNRITNYQNLEAFKTTGFSLSNEIQYLESKLSAGFILLGRANQLQKVDSNLPSFLWTPEVNAGLTQNFPKWKTNISIFYKFNGKRPGYETVSNGTEQSTHQTSISAYNQMDLSLNKVLVKGLNVQAGIRNLFNTQNINNTATVSSAAHSTTVSSIPMSYGRSYFFGLLYNLNI